MSCDTPTGVPDPHRPGCWLVPPWPAGAAFHDVVRHFIRFDPWFTTDAARLRAYDVGFEAALDGAPAQEPRTAAESPWRTEMRDCVARCARRHRPEPAAETPRTTTLMRPAA